MAVPALVQGLSPSRVLRRPEKRKVSPRACGRQEHGHEHEHEHEHEHGDVGEKGGGVKREKTEREERERERRVEKGSGLMLTCVR